MSPGIAGALVFLELPSTAAAMYDATSHMTVTVLLFASYADALGAASLDLELPRNVTVTEVVAAVRSRPGAERLPSSPLVAVNLQFARGDHVIRDGDEVALIPPVAGG